MHNIIIFDTTLRDGEQSPGASMNTNQKIQIALQLEKLGVDIIEAGFAASSEGDFDAIAQISKELQNTKICSLARAVESDIKKAGDSIAKAKHQRIHTFIATSPIHMKYKLKISSDEVIKRAVAAVSYARTFVEDVEFSLEDAGRSDIGFMKDITDAVLDVGAGTINLPDTVGYRLPFEIYDMVETMAKHIGKRAIISLHNHNDLGLAVANTLAGITAGARQVECTINGLGERAGNAALEELVMAIKVRKDHYDKFDTNINTRHISPTSKLVATITGIQPQPNKAIVGKNAFSHESGIHQDGVLKHKQTYEIMKPKDIGVEENHTIVLGKLSGRAAFRDKVLSMGFDNLSETELKRLFDRFKLLCDMKKTVHDDDIRFIISDERLNKDKLYELKSVQINNCTGGLATATIAIVHDEQTYSDASIGDGAIDAVFKAIDRVTKQTGKLMDYQVQAVGEGKDALAKVVCKVKFGDAAFNVIGHGLNIDTVLASARAYLGALNSYLSMSENSPHDKHEV